MKTAAMVLRTPVKTFPVSRVLMAVKGTPECPLFIEATSNSGAELAVEE